MVALQEVWCASDWKRLRRDTADVYPHCVRWSAGLLGSSGLAILAKHPIVRSRFVPFSACGPIDRLWQGDWFAAKGVAMVTLALPDGALLDVYTAHLHSQYGSAAKYTAVRTVQADELAWTVASSSAGRRAFLLLADLNGAPDDLPQRLLFARLPGALDAGSVPSADGTPASEIDNATPTHTYPSSFYHKKDKPMRMDYILAGGARLADGPAVVERGVALSDHCAVHARLLLLSGWEQTRVPNEDVAGDASILAPLLREAVGRAARHKHRVGVVQTVWDVLAVLCLVGFIAMTIVAAVTITNDMLTTLLILLLFALQPVLTITMVIAAALGRIFYHTERIALREALRRWRCELEAIDPSAALSTEALSVKIVSPPLSQA